MCGYCIEASVAFSFVEREKSSENIKKDDCWMPIYLQEAEDIVDIVYKQIATDHLARSIDVVFYRIWEILLFQERFEVCRSLFDEVDQEAKNDFLGRLKNNKYSGLFGPLGEGETYIDSDDWKRFAESKDQLIEGAIKTLNDYCNFWVLGVGKEKSDPERRLRETGVMDPVENTTPKDWNRFYSLFSIAYFSFLILLKYRNDDALIKRIALGSPHDTPDFFGYDLWLQRKAFTVCVRNYGIRFIQENIDSIRLELIYYSLLKRAICTSELDALKNHLLSYDYFSIAIDSETVIGLINDLQSIA